MKNWVSKLIVFISAGLLYFFGNYFSGYWFPNLTWPLYCSRVISGSISYCDRAYIDIWSGPLIIAGEIFAVIGVLLLFANEHGFRKWWKLSRVYVPIALILTIVSGPFKLSPLALLDAGPGSYDILVWLFGILYIVITLGIVLYSRFKKVPAAG